MAFCIIGGKSCCKSSSLWGYWLHQRPLWRELLADMSALWTVLATKQDTIGQKPVATL
jgi:hypothetical protein